MPNSKTANNIARNIKRSIDEQSDLPAGMVPHPKIKGEARAWAVMVADAIEEAEGSANFDRHQFFRDCGL